MKTANRARTTSMPSPFATPSLSRAVRRSRPSLPLTTSVYTTRQKMISARPTKKWMLRPVSLEIWSALRNSVAPEEALGLAERLLLLHDRPPHLGDADREEGEVHPPQADRRSRDDRPEQGPEGRCAEQHQDDVERPGARDVGPRLRAAGDVRPEVGAGADDGDGRERVDAGRPDHEHPHEVDRDVEREDVPVPAEVVVVVDDEEEDERRREASDPENGRPGVLGGQEATHASPPGSRPTPRGLTSSTIAISANCVRSTQLASRK